MAMISDNKNVFQKENEVEHDKFDRNYLIYFPL